MSRHQWTCWKRGPMLSRGVQTFGCIASNSVRNLFRKHSNWMGVPAHAHLNACVNCRMWLGANYFVPIFPVNWKIETTILYTSVNNIYIRKQYKTCIQIGRNNVHKNRENVKQFIHSYHRMRLVGICVIILCAGAYSCPSICNI